MTAESWDSAVGSPTPLAHEISTDIERAMLQLVVDGFERWRMGGFTRFGDYEDHYTVRLVACMNEIRRERNLAFVPLFRHVEPSNEMSQGLSDPTHAPCIDMVIAWEALSEDSYLRIECKRLAPDDSARRYVVCGMARFVRGYYGAEARFGAMVGYVISGALHAVVTRVNAYVSRSPDMGSHHLLGPAAAIVPLKTVFESNHMRAAEFQPIRITHLFFDMSGI